MLKKAEVGRMAAIVVNSRYESRPITGVERYAREVIKRLGPKVSIIKPRRRLRGIQGHLWEQIELPRQLEGGEVLWSPANTGPLKIEHQVVTIHDISPLDHPEWYAPAFVAWYRFLMPRLAKRVRKVITDSQFSKGRIIERLAIDEKKVISIPCGVDHAKFHPYKKDEAAQIREKYALREPYLLAVGSLNPRKNLNTLFQAWRIIGNSLDGMMLVIVGSAGRAFKSLELDNLPKQVRFLGYINDDDLPLLYASARCFIFPSYYEGFGLPILEAMACGVPVIASKATALPEVLGDAGIQFDPTDVDELAADIRHVIDDEMLSRDLVQRGLQRAKEYSWEQTRDQIWAVLNEPWAD